MSHTILVVDDEEEIRRLLQRTLTKCGYTTLGADDAVQGLVQVQDNDVDLVVTDLRMPGIDGLDFIGQLHDLNPDLPVIVITGYGTYETALEAVRRGAFFFISKPFDNETIVETIQKGLRVPKASRSGATSAPGARLQFLVTAPPSPELSEGVIASLLPLMNVYGFDNHTAHVRLPFVVDEMIERATRHGATSLTVEAILTDGRVELTFSAEQGAPYSPSDLPSAPADFDLSTDAGVGLLVANQHSDELIFAPGGDTARAILFHDRRADG